MKKLFFDIGGWNGASAAFFLATHPQAREFEIHTFECDVRNLQAIEARRLPITLVKKAAWTFDGFVRFYPSGSHTLAGGTMYASKTTGNISPKRNLLVPCVDIAKYIRNVCTKSDYIMLKLNCEGAEYAIIPHLQYAGLLGWVDKWYVQWHWTKLQMTAAEHEAVARLVPDAHPWDCQCHAKTFKSQFLNTL